VLDTLSDGPSDVLSESDDDYDDDVDNKSYSGFEPEIARKMKNVCHLAGDSESGSIKKQDNDDRSEIYAGGKGDCDMSRLGHYFKLKNLLEEIQW
jgi:hypothetical protein